MRRRFVGSVLVVLTMLLALLLTACGDSPTATTSPTTAAATTAATSATTAASSATTAATSANGLPNVIKMPAQIAGGRQVSIEVVGQPLDTQPDAVKLWNEQVARFQKMYPNVTVKGSQYQYTVDSFAALVAGKQVPTLFSVYLTDPSRLIEQGIAADITPYFESNNLKSIYNPDVLSLTMKDGKAYGIPEFAYGMGLAYNLNMFKEAGLNAPPQTWDELATYAKKLTKRDSGRAGLTFITDGTAATGWQYTTIGYTFGAKVSDFIKEESGAYKSVFGKGSPVDALKFIQALRWQHDVLPRESLDWAKNGQTLATGQAAMAIMAGDQFSWIRTTYPDVDVKQFAFAPLPTGANGTSVSLIGGNVGMISNAATADQKEAAVYYKLWTSFDPAEVKASLDLQQVKTGTAIGTPQLPLYAGTYQEALVNFRKPYNTMPTQNYEAYTSAVAAGKVKLQAEPGPAGQEYYTAVGTVVSAILTDKSADPAALLQKASESFQSSVLDRLKK